VSHIFGILLIAVVVAIDNALLAGLLLPASMTKKRFAFIVVAILLAPVQIFLAASVDYMLRHLGFRILAIFSLSWMSIQTLSMQSMNRVSHTWITIAKIWALTVIGNLDNFIWLGSELKGARMGLVLSSVGTIPIFVAVALLLSQQCEKQKWILPLGAGMMAWAAASLTLDIPAIRDAVLTLEDAPRATIQALITIALLAIGFGVRALAKQRPASHHIS